MNTDHLMIGNWVNYSSRPSHDKGTPTQWQWTDFDLDPNKVTPIALNEEILLKCGFVKKTDEYYLFPCFEVQIIANTDGKYTGLMFYTRTIHTDFVPIYASSKIDFLHQLQNLYFALTGEELIYTP